MSDHFIDGIQSITRVLRPRFAGWFEVPTNPRLLELGGIARTFIHEARHISVISAVEHPVDGKIDKGLEYHLSVARLSPNGPMRCSSDTARWVQRQFGLDGAEEDNHVPGGVVRNFWRPVADRFVGLECECKDDEPAIVEDKGDFIWRAAPCSPPQPSQRGTVLSAA